MSVNAQIESVLITRQLYLKCSHYQASANSFLEADGVRQAGGRQMRGSLCLQVGRRRRRGGSRLQVESKVLLAAGNHRASSSWATHPWSSCFDAEEALWFHFRTLFDFSFAPRFSSPIPRWSSFVFFVCNWSLFVCSQIYWQPLSNNRSNPTPRIRNSSCCSSSCSGTKNTMLWC